jgi:hypothetical protein
MFAGAPWPAERAAASCAAPSLQIGDDTQRRVTIATSATVTVEGRGFVDGCDDSGGQTEWGCASDDVTQAPSRDVGLSIRQGAQRWDLGSADAGTAEDNRLGQVTWSFDVPVRLAPGRATLIARGAQPLPVVIDRN